MLQMFLTLCESKGRKAATQRSKENRHLALHLAMSPHHKRFCLHFLVIYYLTPPAYCWLIRISIIIIMIIVIINYNAIHNPSTLPLSPPLPIPPNRRRPHPRPPAGQQPMLHEQPHGEHTEAADLEEEQAGPHALDAKGAAAAEAPEPADDEEGVDRVGRGEVGELAFGQEDAFQGHAAGVREEGAAEPRGEAQHLVDDLGAVFCLWVVFLFVLSV